MPEPAAASAQASAVHRFLTFELAGQLYALPASQVAEVIHVPTVARVPLSPPALLGIANLRGEVLPLIGLRELLGLPEATALATATKAIVLDTGAAMGLAVDFVDSLVAVEAGRIETREAELGAKEGELLTGAFPVGSAGEAAKVLDIQALLDRAFAQRARTVRKVVGTGKAARPSPEASQGGPAAETLVTFEVAGQEFALDLPSVQEILPAPAVLVAVPRAEAVVLGVTSLRDRLLPLLSLRGLLGFPAAEARDGREKVVVMRVGDAQVGLVADRARAIVAAAVSQIDPMPPVLAARAGGESRIKAIYRGDAGQRLVSILAPEQLFREDVMQRLGPSSRGEADPSPQDARRQGELQFLVFRLAGDEFGLPIDAVDEVGQVPEKITRVPKTPGFLEGVVNLRGDVLPVVDQRRRFDLPPLDRPEGRRLVVVRTASQRAGLIVDSVSDVLRVAADAVEPAPELTEGIARLVRGVVNLEQAGRIVLVLDPAELLTPAERGLLEDFRQSGRDGA